MTEDDLAANNTSFLSSSKAQTPRPTARSVTLSLSSIVQAGDANEARYWSEQFGLGPSAATRSSAERSIQLNAGSAAVVHDIVIGQTAFATNSKARNTLLAVACGPRVPLYGTTPQSAFQRALKGSSPSSTEIAADRHVPTSGLLATAVALRADGRLLAVGTHAGTIRVADTTTRATLCQFRNGSSVLSIRSIHWFRDGQKLMAAGDDGTMRVFDLKQHNDGNAIAEYRGHGDAIRAAALWQAKGKEAMVATGSYDHTVRLWNLTSQTMNDDNEAVDPCLAILEHGAPVEAIAWIRSTNPDVPAWLVSAGGTHLKVWNPQSGICVSTLQAQHRKTITSLLQMRRIRRETEGVLLRLLTAGLDGLIRIHDWDTETGELRFLHGLKMNGSIPITALACSYNGERFAVGTSDGTVLVRDMNYQPTTKETRKRPPPAGTFRFFQRGQNMEAGADDIIAQDHAKKAKKVKNYDISIRRFRYSDALDEALATRDPRVVIAVLEELSKRHGLLNALSNRDEETLEPILSFTVKYIARPEYSSLLIGLADIIMDIYSDVSGQSETIDELFLKMKRRVMEETSTQKLLSRLAGQIDAVITSAANR